MAQDSDDLIAYLEGVSPEHRPVARRGYLEGARQAPQVVGQDDYSDSGPLLAASVVARAAGRFLHDRHRGLTLAIVLAPNVLEPDSDTVLFDLADPRVLLAPTSPESVDHLSAQRRALGAGYVAGLSSRLPESLRAHLRRPVEVVAMTPEQWVDGDRWAVLEILTDRPHPGYGDGLARHLVAACPGLVTRKALKAADEAFSAGFGLAEAMVAPPERFDASAVLTLGSMGARDFMLGAHGTQIEFAPRARGGMSELVGYVLIGGSPAAATLLSDEQARLIAGFLRGFGLGLPAGADLEPLKQIRPAGPEDFEGGLFPNRDEYS